MAIGQPQMITQANPHQYLVLLLHIDLVLQLSMFVQVCHAHKLYFLQSNNCSDNGDNVPTQSQDEYPDTETDQVLAESISDYDMMIIILTLTRMMKIFIVMTVTISMAIP